MSRAQEEAEAAAADSQCARIAAEAFSGGKAEDAGEAKERAGGAARRRAAEETDLRMVSQERAKLEARLGPQPSRRAVLLAAAGAVLLSLLLGLYMGWREADTTVQGSIPGEPLKLRLEQSLHK